MKKNLIIGGNSYIGNALNNYLKRKNIGVNHTSRNNINGALEFDLLNPSSILSIDLENYETVFIIAAVSSPDICTNEFDYAWKVNVTNTKELINILLSKGLKIIFFSSDTVYGEQAEPFDEKMICNPLGEYALMKRKIEDIFHKSNQFKAVRLSYVFSKIDKFTKYLLNTSQNGEIAELFHPMIRSIIYLEDVLEGVKNISEEWENIENTFINFGGHENLSRINFANILKNNYLSNLRFVEKSPNASFFKSRAQIINMKSPLLNEILKRDTLSLSKAVKKEFMLK